MENVGNVRNIRLTVILRVLGAVLLLAAALLTRNESARSRGEADAWRQLVTLQFDSPAVTGAQPEGWLASAVGAAADAPQRAATVSYWLGHYDALAERHAGAADPDVLFVAANAAFRAARRGRPVGPEAARRLDPVLQAYAGVLKATPRYPDAAYNYEYVVRLRDQLGLMKPVPATPLPAGPIQTSDLPNGPTVHGVPGGPPAKGRPNEIEVLRPRDVGEREAGPDQAPGGTLRRKG